jgi:hypothetical protein
MPTDAAWNTHGALDLSVDHVLVLVSDNVFCPNFVVAFWRHPGVIVILRLLLSAHPPLHSPLRLVVLINLKRSLTLLA